MIHKQILETHLHTFLLRIVEIIFFKINGFNIVVFFLLRKGSLTCCKESANYYNIIIWLPKCSQFATTCISRKLNPPILWSSDRPSTLWMKTSNFMFGLTWKKWSWRIKKEKDKYFTYYIKNDTQCFIRYPDTEKWAEIWGTAMFFETDFEVSGYRWNTSQVEFLI